MLYSFIRCICALEMKGHRVSSYVYLKFCILSYILSFKYIFQFDNELISNEINAMNEGFGRGPFYPPRMMLT